MDPWLKFKILQWYLYMFLCLFITSNKIKTQRWAKRRLETRTACFYNARELWDLLALIIILEFFIVFLRKSERKFNLVLSELPTFPLYFVEEFLIICSIIWFSFLIFFNYRATQNSTHVSISTNLNACGTQVNETEDALIFWNEIRVDAVIIGNVITRTHDINLRFHCSYSRKKMLSVQFQTQQVFTGSEGALINSFFSLYIQIAILTRSSRISKPRILTVLVRKVLRSNDISHVSPPPPHLFFSKLFYSIKNDFAQRRRSSNVCQERVNSVCGANIITVTSETGSWSTWLKSLQLIFQ